MALPHEVVAVTHNVHSDRLHFDLTLSTLKLKNDDLTGSAPDEQSFAQRAKCHFLNAEAGIIAVGVECANLLMEGRIL